MGPNPFKPTAGKMPPILIGRESVIDAFDRGLANGAGAPERLMLITGQRGSGKTVLLTELGRMAKKDGWDVISETASGGMVQRIVESLRGTSPRVTRASIGPSASLGGTFLSLGSVELSRPEAPLTIRAAIEDRLARLPKGKGVLITIDEVQSASRDDLVAISTAVQHVIRDEDMTDLPDTQKHGIALAFAGLPIAIDNLVNDDVLTFLRRCVRYDLGEVRIPDVKNAYISTVNDSGKMISEKDAQTAAEASSGFPFMIQLVGYYMWQSADVNGSDAITAEHVSIGATDAANAFQDSVCAPAVRYLTVAQREFILAMVPDLPEPSQVAHIAERCRKSMSWAGKYRASLIASNLIEPAGRGYVRISMPHLAEYLQTRREA